MQKKKKSNYSKHLNNEKYRLKKYNKTSRKEREIKMKQCGTSPRKKFYLFSFFLPNLNTYKI